MAEVILENKHKCEKRLTIGDCICGDIVLLNGKIYIVIDGSNYSGFFVLLNLTTSEQEEFSCNTECSRYKKALHFDVSDFQEYI